LYNSKKKWKTLLFILSYAVIHISFSKKVALRAQNSYAHVNAGFLFKLDNNGKVLEKPNIIFGGINNNFVSKHIILMY
jgi:hypothetical protein